MTKPTIWTMVPRATNATKLLKFQLNTKLKSSVKTQDQDDIDFIFEVDEAAKMISYIANECGTLANEYKTYDEKKVSI